VTVMEIVSLHGMEMLQDVAVTVPAVHHRHFSTLMHVVS